MPVYNRCPVAVAEMAAAILCEFATHKPLLDAKVRLDYVFAFPGKNGGDAIRFRGRKALGLCKKIPLKQRVMGRGDAEITLDGQWWEEASEAERRALLDHELHHIEIDELKRDDAGRPVIHLREHDFEVGWFSVIAQRHGGASQERQQARELFDRHGQAFWPELLKS